MSTTYDSPAKTREEFGENIKSREGYKVAAVVGLMAALILALFIWSLTQLQSSSPSAMSDASAVNAPTPGLSGSSTGKISSPTRLNQ
ncbi:MAG TPA: hypothetical protein V6C69_04320 [Trichormus sp.]|jgi:hypothetical protein